MPMHNLRQWMGRWLAKPPTPLERSGLRPGVYHYLRDSGQGTFTRFHLRVDRSGAGLLLANATAAARLHPSGAITAKGLLEGEATAAIIARLEKTFAGLKRGQAEADVAAVAEILRALDAPGDNYPILNFDDSSLGPKAEWFDLPLSADVPLAEPQRLVPILERLWELGIPHATILAGPAPQAAWLVRAVERAQDLGMIAGVRGRATDLGQGTLVEDLARAGVDHVNVIYLAGQSAVHDALLGAGDYAQAVALIGRVLASEVCPVVDVALVATTLAVIEETLASIGRMDVHNAGFYAVAAEPPAVEGPLAASTLAQAAQLVEEASSDAEVRFLWYAPLRFTPALSLAEQVQRGPRCSGDLAIRVEPDGAVLAARGPARPAGNLLVDRWAAIRNHPLFADYRRRLLADTRCDDCPGLAVCAAECPRNPAGWAEVNPV